MKDMTEEEVLAFLKAHPYGTAETTPSGLDISMIRADLKLTPEQRLVKAVRLTNFGLSLWDGIRRQKLDTR